MEPRASRFNRDWENINDDRKVRGFDNRSEDRKSNDFPDWDSDSESGIPLRSVTLPATIVYNSDMKFVANSTLSNVLHISETGTLFCVLVTADLRLGDAVTYSALDGSQFVAVYRVSRVDPEVSSLYGISEGDLFTDYLAPDVEIDYTVEDRSGLLSASGLFDLEFVSWGVRLKTETLGSEFLIKA